MISSMFTAICYITMLVMGFAAVQCRKEDPYFFKSVVNWYRIFGETALMIGVFVIITLILVVINPAWYFPATLPFIFFGSFFVSFIHYFKYDKNMERWAAFNGSKYKFNAKYQYGKIEEMDYNQIRGYVKDRARNVFFYKEDKRWWNFLR